MSTATLGIEIQKHYHKKMKADYWLVVLTEHIEEDAWREAYGEAVKRRGWYSRRWEDLPAGFGFRAEAVAQQFSDWLALLIGGAVMPAPDVAPAVQVVELPAITVPSELPVVRPTPTPKAKPTPAEKFRSLADAMESTIESKLAPMSQNWTPKRGREYNSRVCDGRDLQRAQAALRALADAYDAGDVPEILLGVKTKAQVCDMMRAALRSDNHGSYVQADEFSNKSPEAVALQRLVAGAKTEDQRAREAEQAARREIEQLVDELRGVKIDGFFPTPEPVVERMMEMARIEAGNRVLEPSAGIGSIAEAVRGTVTLTLCELRYSLVEILKKKGFAKIVHGDFLEEFQAGELFDRILMNPPFERRQDEKHIRRAYELLAPGGRLVAVATPNGSPDFEAWLESVGAWVEPLPTNSFNSCEAFNRTGVSTRLILITKGR